ncbi:hypothetical protein ABZV67_45845 [Streptomyces sp. NPDC005065]|uniref:hypothetical protein n=1 Tax=Streptomyces sp. NPDC005065 TaxID=3154461 RepID=UPI0033B9BAFB
MRAVWITVIGGIMAAVLGALIPWLYTHDAKPHAQPEVPVSPTDPGDSNSSTGQDGGDSSSGQDGGGATASQVSNNKTLKGNWFQQRGSLKVTVKEVEIEAGLILLHVRVDNGYTKAIHIPLYIECVVNDDTGHTYQCDPDSPFPGTVPAGRFVNGVIQLDDFVQPEARLLSLSLNQIWIPIPGAPDNVTVDDIKVPN